MPPCAIGGIPRLDRRLLVLRFVGDEQGAERGHGDDDDGDGGFGLEPEYHPRGIDLAVYRVAAADFHDADDHREDAETEDCSEGGFSS